MSVESDSPVVYHGTSDSRFPRNEEQKPFQIELTPEEKLILRQCNKESFYYRCLPLAVASMALTQLAVRKGFITPHPTWGTTLSMTGAGFVGWIAGKISYKKKCEDKFVHLEDSMIGDAVRKKRGIHFEKSKSDSTGTLQYGEDLAMRDDPSFSYYSDSDFHPSTGSLNLDTDKNIQYSGLDDRERPSTDRETIQFGEEKENERTRRFTTYEELRRKNREDYDRSQRSFSSRVDKSPPLDQRPLINVDSSPPRRYSSDFKDSNSGRTDGDSYGKF